MTAMTVVFGSRTGVTVGALASTAPATVPVLDRQVSLDVPLLPSSTVPAVRFRGDELTATAIDAEFDDPLDVFDWYVVSTVTPDGKVQRRLEQVISSVLTLARAGNTLTVTARRLGPVGTVESLPVEVRTADAVVATGSVRIAHDQSNGTLTLTLALPPPPPAGNVPVIVLVQGYEPEAQ